MKFRKLPVTIEAVQINTERDAQDVAGVCTGGPDCPKRGPDGSWPHVHSWEGDHTWTPGDWLITGVKGERYFCKPDIFAATYEPAADEVEASRSSTAPIDERARVEAAYDQGWVECASWAAREDLITDCDSQRYKHDRTARLDRLDRLAARSSLPASTPDRPELSVGKPWVYASIDTSGMREIWLMRRGSDGLQVLLAGPVRWPEGWADAYDRAIAACPDRRPPVADTAPQPIPDFRGYALMGAGAYLLQMCDGDERGPELVIYPATEEEKIGRGVGDLGTEIKTEAIPAERIAIRLQFASLEGLGAVEQQLAFIREELNKRYGVAATTGAGGASIEQAAGPNITVPVALIEQTCAVLDEAMAYTGSAAFSPSMTAECASTLAALRRTSKELTCER